MLFGAVATLVMGTLVSIATAVLAYVRLGHPAFLVIAAIDAVMLPVRIMAWRREKRPTDLVFVTGLLWASLVGASVLLVILSRDLPLSLLATAWSFASISGIVGRNFLAPRYAMTQVSVIVGSMACGVAIVEPNFLVFVACQGALFIAINLGLIRRQREMTIRAVTSEMESRAQSLLDPLTGLLNRRGLESAFEAVASPPALGCGLLYLDLDGFKQVNDRLGHGAGDRLLKEVGGRLVAATGPGTAVCRLGGDEFLVLVPKAGAGELRSLGDRIIASVAAPYRIEDTVFARVGASVGAVVSGPGATDLARMMTLADQALYAAKAAGKGRCILHGNGAPDVSDAKGTGAPIAGARRPPGLRSA